MPFSVEKQSVALNTYRRAERYKQLDMWKHNRRHWKTIRCASFFFVSFAHSNFFLFSFARALDNNFDFGAVKP